MTSFEAMAPNVLRAGRVIVEHDTNVYCLIHPSHPQCATLVYFICWFISFKFLP